MRLRRTLLGGREFYIYAWPSKGGVIILDHADAIDLEYLGLDPIDLPKRDSLIKSKKISSANDFSVSVRNGGRARPGSGFSSVLVKGVLKKIKPWKMEQ